MQTKQQNTVPITPTNENRHCVDLRGSEGDREGPRELSNRWKVKICNWKQSQLFCVYFLFAIFFSLVRSLPLPSLSLAHTYYLFASLDRDTIVSSNFTSRLRTWTAAATTSTEKQKKKKIRRRCAATATVAAATTIFTSYLQYLWHEKKWEDIK